MKKRHAVYAALVCLLATPAAFASEYGCKVLLCLANPNGPRALSECRPPIDKLFRDLARGRSFPSCELASSRDAQIAELERIARETGVSLGDLPVGSSWAQQGYSHYDPCPEGTSALPSGSYAIQGAPTPHSPWDSVTYYTGIGEGDGLTPGSGDGYSPLPGKVCVGTKLGDSWVGTGSGDNYSTLPVGVYDRVVLLDAQGSPRIIDVYVNSALMRRVRW